jgi:hypothetical protein
MIALPACGVLGGGSRLGAGCGKGCLKSAGRRPVVCLRIPRELAPRLRDLLGGR